MEEEPIQPEQVLEIFKIGQPLAERIARYATLRGSGMRRADVRREMNISESTAATYERSTDKLRTHLGLPPLSKTNYANMATFSAMDSDIIANASASGKHTRWHAQTGRFDPACSWCRQGQRSRKDRNP